MSRLTLSRSFVLGLILPISLSLVTLAEPLEQPPFTATDETPWYAHDFRRTGFGWGGEYAGQNTWKRLGAIGSEQPHYERSTDQEVKLGGGFEHFDRFLASATLKVKKVYRSGSRDTRTLLDFETAYVACLSETGNAQLSLGRKYYEDRRGFLFHQSLDGLHGNFRWTWAENEWELYLVRGRQAEGSEKVNYRLAQVTVKQKDRDMSVYYLDRQQLAGVDKKREFLGLRSSGRLINSIEHWAEFALMGGVSESSQGKLKRRAWGIDLGLLWPIPGSPVTAIAGYAVGSGDRNHGDGVDRQFRQSGLQLNNGWVGRGGTKLKYFGELLKPELSNLAISTLGLRWNVDKTTTLEVLHHRYRQPVAAVSLRAYGLSVAPGGLARSLGREWDVVISRQLARGLKVELNLARFSPGKTYDGDLGPLSMAYIDLRYRF